MDIEGRLTTGSIVFQWIETFFLKRHIDFAWKIPANRKYQIRVCTLSYSEKTPMQPNPAYSCMYVIYVTSLL